MPVWPARSAKSRGVFPLLLVASGLAKLAEAHQPASPTISAAVRERGGEGGGAFRAALRLLTEQGPNGVKVVGAGRAMERGVAHRIGRVHIRTLPHPAKGT